MIDVYDDTIYDMPGVRQSADPLIQRGTRVANMLLKLWDGDLEQHGLDRDLSRYTMLVTVVGDGPVFQPMLQVRRDGDGFLYEGDGFTAFVQPTDVMLVDLQGNAPGRQVARKLASKKDVLPPHSGPLVAVLANDGFRTFRMLVGQLGELALA